MGRLRSCWDVGEERALFSGRKGSCASVWGGLYARQGGGREMLAANTICLPQPGKKIQKDLVLVFAVEEAKGELKNKIK